MFINIGISIIGLIMSVAPFIQSIHYIEDNPLQQKINFSLQHNGQINLEVMRIKPNCPNHNSKDCWEKKTKKTTLEKSQLKPLLKPFEKQVWQKLPQQKQTPPGAGHFSLKITTSQKAYSNQGSIYQALENSTLAQFRQNLLQLIKYLLPKQGGDIQK